MGTWAHGHIMCTMMGHVEGALALVPGTMLAGCNSRLAGSAFRACRPAAPAANWHQHCRPGNRWSRFVPRAWRLPRSRASLTACCPVSGVGWSLGYRRGSRRFAACWLAVMGAMAFAIQRGSTPCFSRRPTAPAALCSGGPERCRSGGHLRLGAGRHPWRRLPAGQLPVPSGPRGVGCAGGVLLGLGAG